MIVNILRRLFALPLFVILIFILGVILIVIGFPYWIFTGNVEDHMKPLVHKIINWYWGK